MSVIRNVAVIGSGTMGGGIAISAITAGRSVALIDSSRDMLDRALARAEKYLSRQVEKQRMDQPTADAAFALLTVSTDMDAASEADLVIEAVFEDLDTKRDVFAKLEKVVSDACILATNTSALKVGDIATALDRPQRFCGTHYFSPAEVNPVVEVITAKVTADQTIEAVLSFLTLCRKTAIRCKDQSGFALNRFFCPYTNEAARCLDDGLGTPAQIDAVARDTFGVPIGPFAVMNIVKPRINLAAIRSLEALGPFYAPAKSMIVVGNADKSWDIVETQETLAEPIARQVSERLTGAVLRAVQEELDEAIAIPNDIDLGARMAFGFQKGPCQIMNGLGTDEILRLIELVAR